MQFAFLGFFVLMCSRFCFLFICLCFLLLLVVGLFLGGSVFVCFCFCLSFLKFLMELFFSVYISDVIAGKVIDHIFTLFSALLIFSIMCVITVSRRSASLLFLVQLCV